MSSNCKSGTYSPKFAFPVLPLSISSNFSQLLEYLRFFLKQFVRVSYISLYINISPSGTEDATFRSQMFHNLKSLKLSHHGEDINLKITLIFSAEKVLV